MAAATGQRRYVLERIARGISERAAGTTSFHVAIDGPDAAGKTRFARDLDDLLHPMLTDGAELRRFSADDLIIPLALRRSEQAADPRWVYENVYPLDRIREITIGDPAHEHPGTVVLVDGMSLQRPELEDLWHLRIYLSVPESVTIERVLARLNEEDDEPEAVAARYRERYLPALELYREIADPIARSEVLIDMRDADNPVVVRWGEL
jgi:uridine kinase